MSGPDIRPDENADGTPHQPFLTPPGRHVIFEGAARSVPCTGPNEHAKRPPQHPIPSRDRKGAGPSRP